MLELKNQKMSVIYSFVFVSSDYEDMPLQNGRAIKATAKYKDSSDSD